MQFIWIELPPVRCCNFEESPSESRLKSPGLSADGTQRLLAENSPWPSMDEFEAECLDYPASNDIHYLFDGIREIQQFEISRACRSGIHHFAHEFRNVTPV